jgi:lysophospholipase L1-like esterase
MGIKAISLNRCTLLQSRLVNSELNYMLKIIYLALVHALLIVFLFKSSTIKQMFNDRDVVSPYYLQMTAFHHRVDANLGPGLNIFIGDSLVQGLAVNSIINNSVNFGIGGDTTSGVLKRLPLYQSIAMSKRVIFAVGHNDLYHESADVSIANFKKIFDSIPPNVEVLICSIFFIDENIAQKVNNLAISELNNKLQDLTDNYSHINYIDTNQWAAPLGTLDENLHIGDGVHLNKRGNELWISQLKIALNKNDKK